MSATPTNANAPVVKTEALAEAGKPLQESQQQIDTAAEDSILSDGSTERAALRVALNALPRMPITKSQKAWLTAVAYVDDFVVHRPGRPSKNSAPVQNSVPQVAAEQEISERLLAEAVALVRELQPGDPRREKIANGQIDVGCVYDEVARNKRNAEIRNGARDLTADESQIILADPPWKYDDGGVRRPGAAESQYPTMSLDELIALRPRIDKIAAKDSMLLLWGTSPLLREALRLVEAWGFDYLSSAVWHKTGRLGMGNVVRIDHELLLVGRRGRGIPVADHGVRSVFSARVTRHSEKPVAAYELIERLWPDARKIELFARRSRPGWTPWGAEAPINPTEVE